MGTCLSSEDHLNASIHSLGPTGRRLAPPFSKNVSDASLSSSSTNSFNDRLDSPSRLRHVQREKSNKKLAALERASKLPWTAKETSAYAALEDKAKQYERTATAILQDATKMHDLQTISQMTMCLQIQCQIYDEQIAICDGITNRVALLKM